MLCALRRSLNQLYTRSGKSLYVQYSNKTTQTVIQLGYFVLRLLTDRLFICFCRLSKGKCSVLSVVSTRKLFTCQRIVQCLTKPSTSARLTVSTRKTAAGSSQMLSLFSPCRLVNNLYHITLYSRFYCIIVSFCIHVFLNHRIIMYSFILFLYHYIIVFSRFFCTNRCKARAVPVTLFIFNPSPFSLSKLEILSLDYWGK